MKIGAFLPVLCLLFVVPLHGGLPPELEHAARILDQNRDAWAYTQTTVFEGKTTVERFDPSRPLPQRWELLLKDGQKPTAKEIRDYRKEKTADEKRARARFDPGKIIRLDTLRRVGDTAGEITWEFRINPPDERARKLMEKVLVRATVTRDGLQPARLEIFSQEPITPFLTVHLDRFVTTMVFSPVTADGPSLPHQFRASTRGRAFFVKSLDHDVVTTFSDYERISNGR